MGYVWGGDCCNAIEVDSRVKNALMHSDAKSGNNVWSSFEQTIKGSTKHTTESRVARAWSEFGDVL